MTFSGYITSNQDLDALLNLLRKAKVIALDTEFTRRTTYYPILSLIQIAFRDELGVKKSFVIDCLCDLDLSEIFQIIADKKIIKILHSAAQDLQIFHQLSKLLPQSIFDTQIMGNLCGYGFNLGYSKLVAEFFNQTLDKDQQDSDWQRRPLSKRQIEYAALDVVFLEEIYDIFLDRLAQKNRLDWLLEEMDSFIQKSLFKKDESLFRDFSFKNKSAIEVAQIKNLAIWREKWAQKINIPRKHFLLDEEIEKMVLRQNCDLNLRVEMLDEIKQIFELCDEVIVEKQESIFMGEKQKALFLEVKKFISELARQEDLQEQILITSLEIRTIICKKNLFNELVFGWRYKLLGQGLKEIIGL